MTSTLCARLAPSSFTVAQEAALIPNTTAQFTGGRYHPRSSKSPDDFNVLIPALLLKENAKSLGHHIFIDSRCYPQLFTSFNDEERWIAEVGETVNRMSLSRAGTE